MERTARQEPGDREQEPGNRSQGTGARGQETDAAPAQRAKTRQRKPWKPGSQDHLIYQWVRFEGKSQIWVAQLLEISQPTVSRTLQRYERWQARAEPREGGRLDHAERLRAQRWMTYERNERILASCLRIAGEMEGFTYVSKSVVSSPLSSPSAERELRTVHSVIDRSGIASRFLRLAFRINMEQLKLTEQEPLEPLPPLTEGELEEIELEEQEPGDRGQETADREQETGDRSTSGPAIVSTVELDREQEDEEEDDGAVQDESPVEMVHRRANAASEVNLNKVNNCIAAENGASADSDGTCATNRAEVKIRGTGMNSTHRRRPKRAGRDAECPTQDPHPGPLVNEVGAFCDTVADGREGALP